MTIQVVVSIPNSTDSRTVSIIAQSVDDTGNVTSESELYKNLTAGDTFSTYIHAHQQLLIKENK